MAREPLPAGVTAIPGRYRCASCDEQYEVQRVKNLPVCPRCQGEYWWPASGQRSMYGPAEQKAARR